jgi:hypothetical protein
LERSGMKYHFKKVSPAFSKGRLGGIIQYFF